LTDVQAADPEAPVRFSRGGAIARLTFARPRQLNALSPRLIEQALRSAEAVAASDARVLIVEGEGKSFSAGVDLKATAAADFRGDAARAFSAQARQFVRLLETMPQATIARVTGHCFTGGLEIALGCDFIVASDDAVFCDTHAKLGLRPGWGLSQRLPRRIGSQKAKEMSFTARRIGACEALAIGLVLDVVGLDDLDARIAELADAIAAMEPTSIAAYKALYRAAETHTLDEGLEYEATARFPRSGRPLRLPEKR
jgi:enoyl-CoA hydratase/carnithine racemase